jgi:hypothetical protein
MKLEKFTCHNWPAGKPEYYLTWFPESEPDGITWGPCATKFIRNDIARRILARHITLRNHEETGTISLPDAYYAHEKGLTNYR